MTESTFVEDALRATAAELFGGQDPLVALSVLMDLGWSDLVADDIATAVSVFADEQGRRLGVSRVAELAMTAATGALFDPSDAAIVFAIRPDGGATFQMDDPIDGIVLADGISASTFIVPVEANGDVTLRRISAGQLDATPIEGIDPWAAVTRVRGNGGVAGVRIERQDWEAAVAAGSLAIAHELLGAVGAMLDLAVAHVTDRHQFGVPIGSFQAVQHRLADVLVDLEAARAVCGMAWIDRDRFMCAAALSAARRSFETAMTHCQQVTGAMGSTWEHRLHRYQRRGMLLERLLDPRPTLRIALASVIGDQQRVEVLDG
jgi:Acyl-CoA dehydrogenase, C-terminal domain